MKKQVVHYNSIGPFKRLYAACGAFLCSQTKNKKGVTCKNCKRTKRYAKTTRSY